MPALTFATQVLSILATIVAPGIVFIVALKRGWWRRLEIPIDGGISFGGRPLFGPSKTWLGVLVYGLGATLVAGIFSASLFAGWVAPIFSTPLLQACLAGLVIGLAYAAAELINSFVKRRLRIENSSVTVGRWRPVQSFFDLADGIIAVFIVLLLLETDAPLAISAAVAAYAVHALTDFWMRRLRLKHTA